MTHWNDDLHDEPSHEATTGTGKLLTFFFAAVVLCAVSLGIGYVLGRRSAPEPEAVTGAQPPAASAQPSGAPKPAAAVTQTAEETPASETAAEAEPTATPTPAPAPVKPTELAAAPRSGFMVQVAAVTRQEDAEALAAALRKKQYPVFVLPGSGNDRFFRVQVGPFAQKKDAEAMKTRLASDGYNAILKQ